MAIQQKITINSSPEKIYQAFTDEGLFSQITGAPADFESREGGAFSAFGGQITGRMLDLKPNNMIAQAWRAAAWPAGVYSIVKFTFGQNGDKTYVVLNQAGYPEDAKKHLEGGWHKMYWEPFTHYFGEGRDTHE